VYKFLPLVLILVKWTAMYYFVLCFVPSIICLHVTPVGQGRFSNCWDGSYKAWKNWSEYWINITAGLVADAVRSTAQQCSHPWVCEMCPRRTQIEKVQLGWAKCFCPLGFPKYYGHPSVYEVGRFLENSALGGENSRIENKIAINLNEKYYK
jgi:hypothetical protein